MNQALKKLAGAGAIGIVLAISSAALAAEPIVGNWKTQAGANATISKCGGSFCVKLTSGKYAGKRIGKMSGKGGSYKGTITDPTDNKKYAGSAKVSGASLKMTGCAFKVFCKTQKWRKR